MSGPSDKYASRLACILILFHPPPLLPPKVSCTASPPRWLASSKVVKVYCQCFSSWLNHQYRPLLSHISPPLPPPPPYALYTFYQCQPAAIRTQSEMVNTIINKNKHFIPFPWGTQGRPTTTTVKPKQQQQLFCQPLSSCWQELGCLVLPPSWPS